MRLLHFRNLYLECIGSESIFSRHIRKEEDGRFQIEVKGVRKDHIDPKLGKASYSILATVDLKNELNSYWMDEDWKWDRPTMFQYMIYV